MSIACAEAHTSELVIEKTEVMLVHKCVNPLKLFASMYLCAFSGERKAFYSCPVSEVCEPLKR